MGKTYRPLGSRTASNAAHEARTPPWCRRRRRDVHTVELRSIVWPTFSPVADLHASPLVMNAVVGPGPGVEGDHHPEATQLGTKQALPVLDLAVTIRDCRALVSPVAPQDSTTCTATREPALAAAPHRWVRAKGVGRRPSCPSGRSEQPSAARCRGSRGDRSAAMPRPFGGSRAPGVVTWPRRCSSPFGASRPGGGASRPRRRSARHAWPPPACGPVDRTRHGGCPYRGRRPRW